MPIQDAGSLATKYRPKTFGQVVGQKKVCELITSLATGKSQPRTWLFSGNSGNAKTTIARILAVSYQCTHSENFGYPCEACYDGISNFDIHEVNAAHVNGIDEMRKLADQANYAPTPPTLKRVFIIDEAHKITAAARDMILKPTEEPPRNMRWIFCTTDPTKLGSVLGRRFTKIHIPDITAVARERFVKRIAAKEAFTGDLDEFLQELDAQSVRAPGQILPSLSLFLAGSSAKAAVTRGESTCDVLLLCQSVTKGRWKTVKEELLKSDGTDGRAIRQAVLTYLTKCTVGAAGDEEERSMQAIGYLVENSPFEDQPFLSWLFQALFYATKAMKRPS